MKLGERSAFLNGLDTRERLHIREIFSQGSVNKERVILYFIGRERALRPASHFRDLFTFPFWLIMHMHKPFYLFLSMMRVNFYNLLCYGKGWCLICRLDGYMDFMNSSAQRLSNYNSCIFHERELRFYVIND